MKVWRHQSALGISLGMQADDFRRCLRAGKRLHRQYFPPSPALLRIMAFPSLAYVRQQIRGSWHDKGDGDGNTAGINIRGQTRVPSGLHHDANDGGGRRMKRAGDAMALIPAGPHRGSAGSHQSGVVLFLASDEAFPTLQEVNTSWMRACLLPNRGNHMDRRRKPHFANKANRLRIFPHDFFFFSRGDVGRACCREMAGRCDVVGCRETIEGMSGTYEKKDFLVRCCKAWKTMYKTGAMMFQAQIDGRGSFLFSLLWRRPRTRNSTMGRILQQSVPSIV